MSNCNCKDLNKSTLNRDDCPGVGRCPLGIREAAHRGHPRTYSQVTQRAMIEERRSFSPEPKRIKRHDSGSMNSSTPRERGEASSGQDIDAHEHNQPVASSSTQLASTAAASASLFPASASTSAPISNVSSSSSSSSCSAPASAANVNSRSESANSDGEVDISDDEVVDSDGEDSDIDVDPLDQNDGGLVVQTRPSKYLEDAFHTSTAEFVMLLPKTVTKSLCRRLLNSVAHPLTQGQAASYLPRFRLLARVCRAFPTVLRGHLMSSDTEGELLLDPDSFNDYSPWIEESLTIHFSPHGRPVAEQLEKWSQLAANHRNTELLRLLHARLTTLDPAAAARQAGLLAAVQPQAAAMEEADIVDETINRVEDMLNPPKPQDTAFIVREDSEVDSGSDDDHGSPSEEASEVSDAESTSTATEYDVASITATRTKNRRKEVLVYWKDFAEPTWERASKMKGEPAMDAFLKGRHEQRVHREMFQYLNDCKRPLTHCNSAAERDRWTTMTVEERCHETHRIYRRWHAIHSDRSEKRREPYGYLDCKWYFQTSERNMFIRLPPSRISISHK